MRGRMLECKTFKGCAHLRDLADFLEIEGGDAHAATREADRQPLRLEPPERLAHGHMAGAELLGDVILPQAGIGRDPPRMMRSASTRLMRLAMVSSRSLAMADP